MTDPYITKARAFITDWADLQGVEVPGPPMIKDEFVEALAQFGRKCAAESNRLAGCDCGECFACLDQPEGENDGR